MSNKAGAGSAWSQSEIDALVAAYMGMLVRELQKISFSKAQERGRLASGPLLSRSHGSIEFKMQNVSAVLQGAGLPWIRGYKPRSNYQSGYFAEAVLAAANEAAIASLDADAQPTDDPQILEERVARLRTRTLARPGGNPTPGMTSSQTTRTLRDARVVAWVLQVAEGRCELCGADAPFLTDKGHPYLEVHHPRRLADGGPDVPENAAALCPTCHRMLHYGSERQTALESLYAQVKRLVRGR